MYDTILINVWQAKKLRFLIWLFALFACLALPLAFSIYQLHGFGLALFIAAIGTMPLAGILFYASIYAVEIRGAGADLEIDVLTLMDRKTKRFPVQGLRLSKEHRGRMVTARLQYIDTPWVFLYVRNQRLPFFVDLQAEEVNREALERLCSK